jgi:hypothetical protein
LALSLLTGELSGGMEDVDDGPSGLFSVPVVMMANSRSLKKYRTLLKSKKLAKLKK